VIILLVVDVDKVVLSWLIVALADSFNWKNCLNKLFDEGDNESDNLDIFEY
jgi:hypothetical protein